MRVLAALVAFVLAATPALAQLKGAVRAPMSKAAFNGLARVVRMPQAVPALQSEHYLQQALGMSATDENLFALGALAARLPAGWEKRALEASSPREIDAAARALADSYRESVSDALRELDAKAQAALEDALTTPGGLVNLAGAARAMEPYTLYGELARQRVKTFQAAVRRVGSAADAEVLARELQGGLRSPEERGPAVAGRVSALRSRLKPSSPLAPEGLAPASRNEPGSPGREHGILNPERRLVRESYWRAEAREVWETTKHMLRETSFEVAIVAMLGIGAGVYYGVHHENARAGAIPLAFSERSQMLKDAERDGRTVGPTSLYLTGAADMTAKVFEAWNLAHKHTLWGDPLEAFARELERKTDPSMRIHRFELPDLYKDVQAEGRKVRVLLEPYARARSRLGVVNGHFENAWTESHVDHYRTETYLDTETDSEGKTSTVVKTRQVYDYTQHTYTYHRAAGENAYSTLGGLLGSLGDVRFDETLTPARTTNADGEYAAEQSRRLKQAQAAEVYLEWSRTWKNGSTIVNNLPIVHGRFKDLEGDHRQWGWDKGNARGASYQTGSSFDSGPREYQTAGTALARGREAEAAIGQMIDSVEYTLQATPLLEKKVAEVIAIKLDGKKGNGDQAAKEALELAKSVYSKNFRKGFDVDRFRVLFVLGMAALFGMIGAALGWLADLAGEAQGWWKPRRLGEAYDRFR